MKKTVLFVIILLAIAVSPGFAGSPTRPQLEHFVAECNAGWLNAQFVYGGNVERRRRTRGTTRGHIIIRNGSTKQVHAFAFAKIGQRVGGWTWYSVRSTGNMKAAMLADPRCRISQSWASAWSGLPAGVRDWLKERSTCIGEATRGARTIGVWRCGQVGVTEVRIDGIGPTVLWGGSIYSASGAPIPQCMDGLDNDSDGNIDTVDAQCSSPYDNDEGT